MAVISLMVRVLAVTNLCRKYCNPKRNCSHTRSLVAAWTPCGGITEWPQLPNFCRMNAAAYGTAAWIPQGLWSSKTISKLRWGHRSIGPFPICPLIAIVCNDVSVRQENTGTSLLLSKSCYMLWKTTIRSWIATCLLVRRWRRNGRSDVGAGTVVVADAAAAVILLVVVAPGPLRSVLVSLGAVSAADSVQLALVHLDLGMLLFRQNSQLLGWVGTGLR